MQVEYTYDVRANHDRESCSGCCRVVSRTSRKMCRSVVTLAKVTLVFLNIWVLAVVLVVSLGQWRVFESSDFSVNYDNSHLVVRRELQQEEQIPGNGGNVSLQGNQISQGAAPGSAPGTVTSSLAANIRGWCERHHPSDTPLEKIPKDKLANILVDQKHKFLFCAIPGVALNDWRKILLISNGIVNTTRITTISGGDVFGKYSGSVKKLSQFKDRERVDMLKNFYKVVFVRDPLERVVFAYSNKFKPKWSTYFHKSFGTQIIKKFRKNASSADIASGSSVKFSEFAQYVIDLDHQGTALNEHWMQYYKLCHPCLVNYDFVGTFENGEEDAEKVLGTIGAKAKFEKPYVTDTKGISEDVLLKTYKTVPARDLNNLFKVYSSDYTLFGYKCPKFLHELMKQENSFHDY